MCFRVDCKKCGKHSWGGCGKHLTTLYANIEKGNHCLCKPWPGVATPTFPNECNNLGSLQCLPNNNQGPPQSTEITRVLEPQPSATKEHAT